MKGENRTEDKGVGQSELVDASGIPELSDDAALFDYWAEAEMRQAEALHRIQNLRASTASWVASIKEQQEQEESEKNRLRASGRLATDEEVKHYRFDEIEAAKRASVESPESWQQRTNEFGQAGQPSIRDKGIR